MVEITAAGPDEPGRINDVSLQDYLDWKHNPVTKVFRRFLAAIIARERADHTARWETSGILDVPLEAEARGRIVAISQIHSLKFEEILSFYQEEQQIDDAQTGSHLEG